MLCMGCIMKLTDIIPIIYSDSSLNSSDVLAGCLDASEKAPTYIWDYINVHSLCNLLRILIPVVGMA